MTRSKTLILLFTLLTISCSNQQYVGTELPRIASGACSIEVAQCSRYFEDTGDYGRNYTLYTLYSLEKTGSGTYRFSGSTKIEHEHPAIGQIEYLDLYFFFFNGDTVVREEKIRVRGSADKRHEFSRSITSNTEIESSLLVNYGWRLSE